MNHGYSVFTSQTLCAGKSNWLLNGWGGALFLNQGVFFHAIQVYWKGKRLKPKDVDFMVFIKSLAFSDPPLSHLQTKWIG